MAHVPPVIEDAAAKVLGCYATRLAIVEAQGCDSFVKRFFASLPLSPTNCLKDYADRFLAQVSLPEAVILSNRHDPSDLAIDLGIDTLYRRHACAVITLFLREKDKTFGKCFEDLSEANMESVARHRIGILKRIRFRLMMAHPELALFTLAQPAASKDPHQQQEGVIDGFGTAKVGVVFYSHLAREVMLFSFLDTLLQESGNAPVILETLVTVMACYEQDLPNDARLNLFDSVILPFYADIVWWTKRIAGATDESLEFQDALGHGNLAEALPHAALGPEKKRLQASILELRQKVASAEGEEQAKLHAELEKRRHQLAVVDSQMLAEMKSQPLLSGDPELCRQLEMLLAFVREVETCQVEVRGPKNSHCLFRDVFRLRFALGLLSFRSTAQIVAPDHVARLAELFGCVGDALTGNALAFLKENPSREPWGEKRSDGRHFYGVLNALADRHGPVRAADPARDRPQDVKSVLTQIVTLLPQKLRAIPRPEIGPDGWETKLYGWAFGAQEVLESEYRRVPGLAGARSSLAALSSLLIELLVPSPERALRLCVDLVNQTLPRGEYPLNVPESTRVDRSAFRKRVREVQHKSDDLVTKWAVTLLDHLMTELLRKAMRKDAPKKLDELEPKQRKVMQAKLKALDGDPQQTDARLIYDFFIHKWAQTQPVADKERWQYLAYRLAHALEIPAYAELYSLVSRHVAATLPHPLNELPRVYDSIQKQPGFENALEDFRHSIGLLRPTNASWSSS